MRRDIRVIAAAFVILMLATIPVASAQSPRVGFSVTTSTDLAASDPVGEVVGDFNEDGHLDLMVTLKGAATTNVKLLTGNGTGSFSYARGFSFAEASAIAAADFNGDGALDVAITQDAQSKQNSGYSDFICGSLVGVAIFLGPEMSSARCVATVPRPIAVQAGDFDGDGRPDIAVVSATGLGLKIYRQLNFVNHTLTLTNVANSAVLATSMAPPVDLNADGRLDLVVGHASGVRAFLGNGDGTFLVGGSVGGTNRAQAVAVGDLNGDGVLDIAEVEATSGGLLVGFGAGDGTFSTQTVATIGSDLTAVMTEDLDHDGRTDVIVAHKGGGTIPIFFGNGVGTFVTNPALALSVTPKSLLVRDVDEDGDLDLVIFGAGGTGQNALLWIALQDGIGPHDVMPPTVTLASPVPGGTVSGTVGVAATASDNVGITNVEFYAGATLIAKSAGPNYIVRWNTKASPNGPVTVTARAFDAALNESLWSSLEVTVANAPVPDTTPPVVNVPWAATIEATGPGGAVFTFAASAIDGIDGPVAVTCAPASGSTFPVRVTTATCSATDAQGNTASASFTVTVRDSTPPDLTLPSNATIQTVSPVGAVFVYTASAIDVVDGTVAGSCIPASGTTFSVGVTTVTCSAADTTGNRATGSFTVTVIPTGPPGAAFPVSPSGAVATVTPAFTWNAVMGTTYYLLRVVDRDNVRTDRWYRPSDAACPLGAVTCSVSLESGLPPGPANWQVLTWNGFGFGPWSDPRAFTVDIADPALATPQPLSPIGTIAVTSPTFAWTAVPGAMSYRLSIRSNGGPAVHWWFSATAAGCLASEVCSAVPQGLPSGTAEWQIQAWSVNGRGDWSAPLTVVVNTRAPTAPTLLSPHGATDATPPFVWNASADAVWFYVEIYDATGLRVGRWVRPDQAGCPNGIGACTVNAGITLEIGAGAWRVIAWNPTGYSPWSDTMTFVRAN